MENEQALALRLRLLGRRGSCCSAWFELACLLANADLRKWLHQRGRRHHSTGQGRFLQTAKMDTFLTNFNMNRQSMARKSIVPGLVEPLELLGHGCGEEIKLAVGRALWPHLALLARTAVHQH